MRNLNYFETKDDAVELGLEAVNELRREQFHEEYRILCIDMLKKSVYFNLFNDFDEYKSWYKLINRDDLYYLLVLPPTTDEEIVDWIKSCYRHYTTKLSRDRIVDVLRTNI